MSKKRKVEKKGRKREIEKKKKRRKEEKKRRKKGTEQWLYPLIDADLASKNLENSLLSLPLSLSFHCISTRGRTS